MSKVKDGGIVTAYGAAVRGGYTGTYQQFCAALGQLTEVLEEFEGFSVEVTTLSPGAPATADYHDGVLTLGIPRGETGNGIQSAVLNSDYTLTLTWTNGQHTTVGPIRGDVGATPNLTIGNVQTLQPSQPATATITGTPEDPVLNLGIPKGEAGASDAGNVTYDETQTYQSGTVGAELSSLKNAISQLGNIAAFKTAILQLAQKVAYIDEHGQDYYDELYDALYPAVPIDSISAVFVQGSTVIYDTDTLDDLKPMLTVTATYEDQTTEVVTDYILSGTLEVGTSIITVTYKGKTDSFEVTVSSATYAYNGTDSAKSNWDDSSNILGVNANSYNLVAEFAVGGGLTTNNGAVPVKSINTVSRATSTSQIITGVSDGQTVGLANYTLSTLVTVTFSMFYGYINPNGNTFNASQYISQSEIYTARAWNSSNVVLPTDSSKTGKRFLMIAFKKGDGSTNFTSAELAELQTLISIT